ncbi:MAG: phosphoribosyltransferase [Lachnospiraceae bacterium]|nr:phosphoribosyltransferase [Lachnospiraceae bacterium]
MEKRAVKIHSKVNNNVILRVIKGHFATTHSHINYFMDMTGLKSRLSEAKGAAHVLARKYETTTVVDTIVCIDGCEVVGAYLADALTQAGVMSLNQHQTIYVSTPEYHTGGQLIFRDNTQMMIRGKNVILLMANVTTGKTLDRALECIEYYGGKTVGIAAIFSVINVARGIEINCIFSEKDVPDYMTYEPERCPLCQENVKIDAMVNSYGYSKI